MNEHYRPHADVVAQRMIERAYSEQAIRREARRRAMQSPNAPYPWYIGYPLAVLLACAALLSAAIAGIVLIAVIKAICWAVLALWGKLP